MPLLINGIESIPHPLVLVLDDYHLIELQAIHEALTFLLDHLPASMHLIITTRADPPLPLARLRARGQLVELRALDLRFSLEEATAFLNERMGLQLTTEQVAALDARAEGWIAGLQLAALSIQGHQNVAGFVHAFARSHRFILDYLVEEVLQHQAPETLDFLLQTCILDQMNAALADAVTSRNDSAQVIAQLEKANLFVVSLDDKREWYRYHHLFADLLNSRLQQAYPEQIPELHRRASALYEQTGSINEAIDHALAAPEVDRAARLIKQVGLSLILRSENATLTNWIARLPEDVIRTRPFLMLIQAAVLLTSGNIEQGSARLAQIDEAQLDPQARDMAGLLRAAMELLRIDVSHGIESARMALEQAEASMVNPADSQAEFKSLVILYLAVILAELQTAAGKLNDAAATSHRALQIGKSLAADSPWAMILGFMHVQLAELLYEWNDLGAAEQQATQGLKICQVGRNEELESYSLVTFAQIKQALGDSTSALEFLRQAEEMTRKRNIISEIRYNAAREIKVLLAQNRIDDAARVLNDLPSDTTAVWDMLERGLVSVAHARVMIALLKAFPVAPLEINHKSEIIR